MVGEAWNFLVWGGQGVVGFWGVFWGLGVFFLEGGVGFLVFFVEVETIRARKRSIQLELREVCLQPAIVVRSKIKVQLGEGGGGRGVIKTTFTAASPMH